MILARLALSLRLSSAVPTLPPEVAYAHAAAASAAATAELPAELLLGVAFIESRFDPTAVSRVEGHSRRTGRYASTAAPPGLDRRAALYCGPLQTYAASWSACMAMRRLDIGYGAAVAELTRWLHDRRVHGNTTRALAGHGCGNFGVATGQCRGYPERVLDMSRRFRDQDAHGRPTARAVAST